VTQSATTRAQGGLVGPATAADAALRLAGSFGPASFVRVFRWDSEVVANDRLMSSPRSGARRDDHLILGGPTFIAFLRRNGMGNIREARTAKWHADDGRP
jgi:hypothetical protein